MNFNFKNKNLTIILLLFLIIGSVICYNSMQNTIEGLENAGCSNYIFEELFFVK